jgi:hypothetical protein
LGFNILIDLQEVGIESMDWIELAQDRGRWRALSDCGNKASDAIKCGEFLDSLKTYYGLSQVLSFLVPTTFDP